MVFLSKIYTKSGDQGQTGLGNGQRVPKDHPRVTAYGEVDELNAFLGAALAAPAIVGLGEISYSIYLAHPFISRVAYVTRENEHPLLSYAVAIAFVLIISEALYRRIEIPSKLFLRRLLGADAPRTAASETEAAIISEEFRNERRLPHSEFPADSSI